MFWHLFVYRLKCMLRKRDLVFWTLLFPLFMATLYHFAFGQMMPWEAFEPIDTAVVDNAAYQKDAGLQQMLFALSAPGEEQLLNLTVTNEEEAIRLLNENAVVGVIHTSQQGVVLEVEQSGLGQSILKAILDDYRQTSSTIESILQLNPAAAPELLEAVRQRATYLVATSFSDADPNPVLISFYALIANTCLFGSSWGLKNTTDTQASLSEQGLRRSAAPTHKLLVVASDTAAALLVTYCEVLILLAFVGLVNGVEFGAELGKILLVCLLGSLAGVALGTAVGTLLRLSEGVKSALLTVTTLFCSFLSGMMYPNMKYIIDRAVPWLSYINPVALISDAFYSLYIFAGLDRFALNLGLLGLIAAALTLASYMGLRREQYASL